MSNRNLRLLRRIEKEDGNCIKALGTIYSYARCRKCPIEKECCKRAEFLQKDSNYLNLSMEDKYKEILALVREKLAKILIDKELRR